MTRIREKIDWFDMPEVPYRASRIFRALGNPKAYAIAMLLLKNPVLSVEQISVSLNRSQPTVSKTLRILRDLDLVRYQRQGNSVVYTCKDGGSLERLLAAAEDCAKRALAIDAPKT